MLVDELEQESVKLGELYQKLQEQERTYRKTVDRFVREEMMRTKKEIQKEKQIARFIIMDYIYELAPLKKHFPDLFTMLCEDQYIGPILKQKEHWANAYLIKDPKKEIEKLREERKQLKEAQKAMEKWPGEVESKAIGATWPVLKEHLKKETMTREEAVEIIKQIDKDKRKRGWMCLVQKGLVESIVNQYAKKLKLATQKLMAVEGLLTKAKGSGTVNEYNALKEYNAVKRKKEVLEQNISHLFLANMEYFRGFKQMGTKIKTGGFSDAALGFIRNAHLPKFNEEEWVKEMKKKIDG